MKQLGKIALISALVLCIMLAAGCKRALTASQTTTLAKTTVKAATQATTKATTAKPATTAAKAQKDTFSLSNYDHISAQKQQVYDRLIEAFEQSRNYMEESVAEFNAQVVDRVFFYNLLADHPKYFYLRGHSNLYEQSDTGERTARFDIEYGNWNNYDVRLEKMQAAVESVKQSLPQKANDFNRAKAAYDYLIKNCEYDYDYTGNSLQESNTTASYADGAIVDHKAVCSGYSRAFKWFMDAFEIPCMCVSNDEHEWNIVMLEGNYYHIDVTWADTDENPGTRYFCVTDAEIYQDHDKPNIEVPECVVVY